MFGGCGGAGQRLQRSMSLNVWYGLIVFCKSNLNRYAYVDGTALFSADTAEQHEDKERAALGRCRYPLNTGVDGLGEYNVGTSTYVAHQFFLWHATVQAIIGMLAVRPSASL